MTFTARDVSKKAITIEPTSNMSNARDVMIRNNISRVIVASNNTPVGMVTEKGIASYLFKNSKEPLDEISISRAMRTPIITVNPDVTLKRCAEMMIENDISSLVITNDTSLNILTKSESCKVLRRTLYKEIFG